MRSLLLAVLVLLGNSFAQEADKPSSSPPKAPAAGERQAELEKNFKELLTNCVFDGRWCLLKDGQLSEEKSEKYTITGAVKTGGEVWLIYARIQYGGKDVTVPVPVQVKWAGDTPVITLDKVTLPGLGTYSARVLVFNKTYAGTWLAGDHGGMLHGLILKQD